MKYVLAALVVLGLWVGIWHYCDLIFRMGEVHGRYLQERENQPVSKVIDDELRDCRRDLSDTEFMSNACDKALLDCTDGARYVSLTCARGFCYK